MKARADECGYLLFVAGLPSRATPEEVQCFFSRLGVIRLLRLRTNKKGTCLTPSNPQNNIRRGFCVVEALDEQTFANLLGKSGTLYANRTLTITKLRDEAAFSSYTADLAKRKVILTRVPRLFPHGKMVQLIEACCGEVRKIGLKKASQKSANGQQALYRDFLVEFTDEESVFRALARQTLHAVWNQQVFRFSLCKYVANHRKAEKFGENSCRKTLKLGDGASNIVGNYHRPHQADSQAGGDRGDCSSLITDLLSWEAHFTKPTSTIYHKTRRPVNDFPWRREIEILEEFMRFNLAPKRTDS